jgi:hypothetical protein
VGNKGNVPFDMDENIFDLDRPCPKAARYKGIKMKDINIPVNNCGVCNKLLQIPKAVQQCAFCALFGCLDCVYKQFPFPQKTVGDER